MWTLKWPTCTQWIMSLKTTLFQFQNQQQSRSPLHLTLNYIAIESQSQRLGEYIETRKMRVAQAFFWLNFIDFIYPWLRKNMMYYCLPGACVKSGVEIAIETWPVSPLAVAEPLEPNSIFITSTFSLKTCITVGEWSCPQVTPISETERCSGIWSKLPPWIRIPFAAFLIENIQVSENFRGRSQFP